MIPYGRQCVDDDDIDAVVRVLRSDWLTTGPAVEQFEGALAAFSGAAEVVCFSSGTAALHGAMNILGIGPGDEVIVSPLTFVASASCILYQGGTPVFADVCPDTLLIDPASVEARITPRTRAVIAVDFAGQPCDYRALKALCARHGLALVADACHSLGARDGGVPVGRLADISALSFHPVKGITTGEGGALLLGDAALAARARSFRNHGLSLDHRQRGRERRWDYDVHELGWNYRLSDIQCALGHSQLDKLAQWLGRRRAIAARYEAQLADVAGVAPLRRRDGVDHAWHLYVVRIDAGRAGVTRDQVFTRMYARGIGVNVHYKPVFRHSLYSGRFGVDESEYPNTAAAAEEILSLPIYPGMSDADVDTVISELCAAMSV